jgi:hypothetical protein
VPLLARAAAAAAALPLLLQLLFCPCLPLLPLLPLLLLLLLVLPMSMLLMLLLPRRWAPLCSRHVRQLSLRLLWPVSRSLPATLLVSLRLRRVPSLRLLLPHGSLLRRVPLLLPKRLSQLLLSPVAASLQPLLLLALP